MMTKRKPVLVLVLFLVLTSVKTIFAQAPTIGVVLNEYCVSNIGGTGSPQGDANGVRGDWVELHSTFSASVNLGGYYLSNDKNNLFKWPFPSNYVIGPNDYKIIWLTGKNKTFNNNQVHANFTMDQCKGQYLILTAPGGNIRDSVYIHETKEGHSRGRKSDYNTIGSQAWRVFPIPTFGLNNIGNSYINYAPKPVMRFGTAAPLATYNGTNAGGFYPTEDVKYINLSLENNVPYDTTNTCFRIYYTLDNGNYPNYADPLSNTIKLIDTAIFVAEPATLVRAIAVPISSGNPAAPTGCEIDYLPSFCETNTYFIHENYQNFSTDFGVVSIAMDKADTSWLGNASNGGTRPVVHVEYYDKKRHIAEGYTELNRPVQEAWATKQKGFYMTIDDRRGFGCNFEGDIFNVDTLGTTPRRVFPTLHLKAGDYESHSLPLYSAAAESRGTAIMDVFLQSLAARYDINVNPLHIKPVITFLNGKYQGVYDLREVYDKHYENFYHDLSADSLDLMYNHFGDGYVTYSDGPGSNFSQTNSGQLSFATGVYALGTGPTISNPTNYAKLFSRLDKENFIDYMILNSFAMNGNLWKYDYDIAYARGVQADKPGSKWHYYLWNTPAIFNFTALSLPNATVYQDVNVSPCFVHNNPNYNVVPSAANGHGAILKNLMSTTIPVLPGTGRYSFQLQYKNRYQDLLNGPLKCETLLKHYDYVKRLFLKEMYYHEDGQSAPVAGQFVTQPSLWDTNTSIYRRGIEKRCKVMADGLGKKFSNCYNLLGPYAITVDVEPAGAGKVKLNTIALDSYKWTGNYYATLLTFKAIPADETYAFHHWEFKNHTPLNSAPLSMDSVQIDFNQWDDVVAVFTDKKNDVTMPTGFTPNGDGINDLFQPLGSAVFTREFDMSVWNRWGQEVYRSTDPNGGWDGNFKGQPAQTGVYAYLITYKNIFSESKLLKGNLTLIR